MTRHSTPDEYPTSSGISTPDVWPDGPRAKHKTRRGIPDVRPDQTGYPTSGYLEVPDGSGSTPDLASLGRSGWLTRAIEAGP